MSGQVPNRLTGHKSTMNGHPRESKSMTLSRHAPPERLIGHFSDWFAAIRYRGKAPSCRDSSTHMNPFRIEPPDTSESKRGGLVPNRGSNVAIW
jgi:hypothetical protein